MRKDTYTMSPDEFLRQTRLPTRIMETEASMYEEISQLMFDAIAEKQGQRCVIICPVGPIAQYPLFVKKVNENNLSLKNVWFFNMDEYLNDDDTMIDPASPLSFKGFMERTVYTQIKPELVMPPEQRLFPTPGHEAEMDALLEKLGYADISLTGVGINGHLAFNEPPAPEDAITDEEYYNLPTRTLPLSKETIVNNGGRKIRGALDIFPRRCISIGMKQLFKTRRLKVYLYCDWQWGVMRKLSLEEPSRFCPASFLQRHPDSEMVITRDLAEFML